MKKTIQEIVSDIDLINSVVKELDTRNNPVDDDACELLKEYRDMLMRRVVDI